MDKKSITNDKIILSGVADCMTTKYQRAASVLIHDINNSLANIETSIFVLKNVKPSDCIRLNIIDGLGIELERVCKNVSEIQGIFRQMEG